ncbi:Transcription factor, fungi [Metarhizium guizhouense ARSEF 977]|uniref:Transcription factor, fungi n=1 Tax=Metarhizium guizhouense (strain ARSEF 977) TaxID=1276136 RepID=A0A0B4HGJ1_METGA|nr:Transcription factor, fungi [Metarhizium guizhouense ARSEF 977]
MAGPASPAPPTQGGSSETPSSNTKRNSSPGAGKTGLRTKYVPRACQECRRRRAKVGWCDGTKPTCSRCNARQIPCVYNTGDDGRGTAQKSYVRLLQGRIALLEKILWLHSIDIHASTAQLMQQNLVPATITSLTASGSTAALDELCDTFEGTLTLDESQNFDQDGEARYFGPASGRLDFKPLNDVNVPRDLPTEYSPPCADPPVQILGHQSSVNGELEAHLLEQYFIWEQPWLQVVDEALFRESRENNGRYFTPLLLNCILASGSRFSDRVEVRSDPNDPNTAGRIFLETAEVLLHFDLKRPTITTIQSLAVLGTVYHAFGQDAAGWLHSGMANRLVLDMGLNLDPGSLVASGRMTAEEAQLRRQVYWSLYCGDKLAAAYTGRVCSMLVRRAKLLPWYHKTDRHMKDLQGAVGMPTMPTHTGPDTRRHALYSVDPRLLVSLHTDLIKLCQILEKILLNLYSPRKLSPAGQRRGFFDSCLLWLKHWLYCLCIDLKPLHGGVPNQFPQAYTLCMVYHTAIILLARPYVQSRAFEDSASLEPDALVIKAQDLLLEAARSISSLGDQYRKVFGSFRRSPITATHANLSAALALFNPQGVDRPRARFNPSDDPRIKSCLQTLEELSVAWTPPRKYLSSVLKMMQGYSAGQQKGATTSDALTDHQDGDLYPTSEASQVTNLMQPADVVWSGQVTDAMSLPLWLSPTVGDPSLGEFSTAAEGMPRQDGSDDTGEQFKDWLEPPFPWDLFSS